MTTRLVRKGAALGARADLTVLVSGAPPDASAGALGALAELLPGVVERAVADGELTGKAGTGTLFHAPGAGHPPRVLVAGIGEGRVEDLRAAGALAARRAREVGADRVALDAEGRSADEVSELVDGFWTGAHELRRFRTRDEDGGDGKGPSALSVHGGGAAPARLREAVATAAAVNSARDLVDTPANHLTPRDLAEYARALAKDVEGLKATVLGKSRLERMGAGALLGVARGSEEPPRLIVLRWEPPKPRRADEVLGVVGKAVTFDSGGISIKPSAGMEEMKTDMAGGAAALEGVALMARLGVPLRAMAVVPSTENMPSGTAVKPGDVLTAMNGRTIEVTNTDAEGRLILADALTYAAREGATRLLDMATLTGAVIVALGDVYAGLLGNDDEWIERVREAGEASGDLAWPLPMHERYAHLVKSTVADLANSSSKRQAGPIYAAHFLSEFVEGRPWCHLDIAGTATPGARASGYGVRLVVALARALAG